MLVVLSAAGAFVYWRVEFALDRGLDTELSQASAIILPLVDRSGQVTSPNAADATGVGWQVLDGGGRVLGHGGPAPADALVSVRDLETLGAATRTMDIGNLLPASTTPYRLHLSAAGNNYLVVAIRRDHRDEALRELVVQLAVAGLGALVVAAAVGDLLARAALRPVERYRRRAEDIAAGAGGLRLDVPDERDDEVTRLGHTLNDMLVALEQALDHERRFVNDASHELRTPLTLLKSRIQLARRRTRSAEEYEGFLDELGIDVARLSDLAEQLLALGASADTGDGTTNANRIVAGIVERRRLAWPDHAHELTMELASPAADTAINPLALGRAVTNLIDNAFTHGQSPVHIRVTRQHAVADLQAPGSREVPASQSWTRIEVEDAGTGMSPDLLMRATGRFTRSPEARSRPGAGLGLSLVEQVSTAAGGELRLCYGGMHSSHGQQAPVPCEHGPAMTTTVLLPTAYNEST